MVQSQQHLSATALIYVSHPHPIHHPKTKDGNPYGWHAHGRRARGQADHKGFAHILVERRMFISGNRRTIILFRKTGVPELNLDRELQLAAINNPV
jgi:hypothetical protein